jgi:hypothetical protein
MEGTMGYYFRDGDDLFAVTARHVLFPPDEGNADYTYNPSGPRKDVLLLALSRLTTISNPLRSRLESLTLPWRSWSNGYRY